MTTFEIPFVFHAYGTVRKRVPQALRVIETFRHDAEERSASEADARLGYAISGRSFAAPVFDGMLYLPCLVASPDGYAPVSAEALREGLRTARSDGNGPLRDLLPHAEPFLVPDDFRSTSGYVAGGAAERLSDVHERLPSDREARFAQAQARAAAFLLVDGVPHTARWEPHLVEFHGERMCWTASDVTLPPRLQAWSSDAVARASLSGVLEVVDEDGRAAVEGDLDAVAWRFLDVHRNVASIVANVADAADRYSVPVARFELEERLDALGALRHAARWGHDLDPADAAEAMRDLVGFVDSVAAFREPDAARFARARRALVVLEAAAGLRSAPAAEDEEALDALTFAGGMR